MANSEGRCSALFPNEDGNVDGHLLRKLQTAVKDSGVPKIKLHRFRDTSSPTSCVTARHRDSSDVGRARRHQRHTVVRGVARQSEQGCKGRCKPRGYSLPQNGHSGRLRVDSTVVSNQPSHWKSGLCPGWTSQTFQSADILAAHEVVDGNGEPDAHGNRDVKVLPETVEDGIQSHPHLYRIRGIYHGNAKGD